jgi:hypothetical protein
MLEIAKRGGFYTKKWSLDNDAAEHKPLTAKECP